MVLEAATLERLAPGRTVLGVGLGAPDDFTTFGEDADWRVRSRKVEESLATIRESLPDLPVWVSGEWPRKQPFHGVDLADGVFPIHRDGEQWRPLTPDEAGAAVASLPERARRDFAIWSFNDEGHGEPRRLRSGRRDVVDGRRFPPSARRAAAYRRRRTAPVHQARDAVASRA